MNKNQRKILSSIGASVMGIGAIATPITLSSTSCSINSGLTNLVGMIQPSAKLETSDLINYPVYSESDLEQLYFANVNNDNNIFINDLYYNLSKYIETLFNDERKSILTDGLDMAPSSRLELNRLGASISNFTLNYDSEHPGAKISMNLMINASFNVIKSESGIETTKSNEKSTSISRVSFLFNAEFNRIPLNLRFNPDVYLWSVVSDSIGGIVYDSFNATLDDWSIKVNEYSLRVDQSINNSLQRIRYSNFTLNPSWPDFPGKTMSLMNILHAGDICFFIAIGNSAYLRAFSTPPTRS